MQIYRAPYQNFSLVETNMIRVALEGAMNKSRELGNHITADEYEALVARLNVSPVIGWMVLE